MLKQPKKLTCYICCLVILNLNISLIYIYIYIYIYIKFNENSDIVQFERDNSHINLFIIDIDGNPVFLTRNNGSIQVTIVKLNDNRYTLVKPSIKRYIHNINEINRINKLKRENYKLTDEIKKDLCLRFDTLNCN